MNPDQLLVTGDAGYDQARRIWNGMIDRHPALIARCTSTADVVEAVKLAVEGKLTVSVKGGGHNVAGNAVCDGGLMIDLSPMKDIQVDVEARTATAQPGVLWGEFDAVTVAHGLATPGGQVSHTGIAGLTLGGGLGYLMGLHGATCDNLLSVEVVTAQGEVLTANQHANADLFWAIRGGGGNFGIVTSFLFRLHPMGPVTAGLLIHPQARANEILAFYREFIKTSPDCMNTTVAFMKTPDGLDAMAIIVVYFGTAEQSETVLRPLRNFGPPLADLIAEMPYTQAQKMADHLVPIGNRYYWKSNFADAIADGLIDVLTSKAPAMPSPQSMILVFEMSGEIQRKHRDSAAFDHRDCNHEVSIIGNWTSSDDDAANIAWVRETWDAAQPFLRQSVYVNHLSGDEPAERIRAAYGPGKYDRLVAVKRKYDPRNFFRFNQNIVP
ncbi:MAG: FAD-binding oxidoreductase [Acidobacteria bacterium]|nr:FAD-binding oxidoreductase [Acidobacteriota bacterium]